MAVTVSCPLCGNKSVRRIIFDSVVMPTVSSNPRLHSYDNFLCEPCGVSFQSPCVEESSLRAYYNSGYRRSPYALALMEREIDLPIAIPWSGVSFQRFRTFHDMLSRFAAKHDEATPGYDDWIVDIGAYQGVFLYASKEVWGCRTLAVDYNTNGLNFAKAALGIDETFETRDIYSDTYDRKFRFASLVHALEHLRDPLRFLIHLRADVLKDEGILYVEVPNLCACPLSDPTHYFMYSPEGLKRLLARAGFETLALTVHGHPRAGATWDNDRMNISGLFRPNPAVSAEPEDRPALRYSDLARTQREVARSVVARHARSTARAMGRLAYYIAFVLGVECIAPRSSRVIKKRILHWFHPA